MSTNFTSSVFKYMIRNLKFEARNQFLSVLDIFLFSAKKRSTFSLSYPDEFAMHSVIRVLQKETEDCWEGVVTWEHS